MNYKNRVESEVITDLNLNGNRITNFRIDDNQPINPVDGSMYYDHSEKSVMVFIDGEWVKLSTGGPDGNKYLPLIQDLDKYSGNIGDIVKYVGPTNGKYINGYDYKLVGSLDPIIVESGTKYIEVRTNAYGIDPGTYYCTREESIYNVSEWHDITHRYSSITNSINDHELEVGDYVYDSIKDTYVTVVRVISNKPYWDKYILSDGFELELDGGSEHKLYKFINYESGDIVYALEAMNMLPINDYVFSESSDVYIHDNKTYFVGQCIYRPKNILNHDIKISDQYWKQCDSQPRDGSGDIDINAIADQVTNIYNTIGWDEL